MAKLYVEQLTVITLLPVKIATVRKGTTTNPINSRPVFPTQKHSTLMGMFSDFIRLIELASVFQAKLLSKRVVFLGEDNFVDKTFRPSDAVVMILWFG